MFLHRTLWVGAVVSALLLGAGCDLSLTPTAKIPSQTAAPVEQLTDGNRDARLQPIIEEYIGAKLGTLTHKGKPIVSYVKYGEEEKEGKLMYYIFVHVEEFYRVGDKLARANTRLTPIALTLIKENEFYRKVVGHQIPDPKKANSLSQVFPKIIADKINILKAADIKKRNDQLAKENVTKAQNAFGLSNRFDVDQTRTEKCLNLTFQDYVISEIRGNQAVDVIFDSYSLPSLESWKSAREGLLQTHTFAKSYYVKSIGCGRKCYDHRIYDMRNNKEIKYLRSQYGLDFGSNSRLLVVNPYRYMLDPNPKGITTQFYILSDANLDNPRLELKCSYTDRTDSSTQAPSFELITSTPQNSVDTEDSGGRTDRRYMSRDQNECATMNTVCADNETVFTDDTGCGCQLSL